MSRRREWTPLVFPEWIIWRQRAGATPPSPIIGPKGRNCCRWCRKELKRTDKRAAWCSEECVSDFRRVFFWGDLREYIIGRDKVCTRCGCDYPGWRKKGIGSYLYGRNVSLPLIPEWELDVRDGVLECRLLVLSHRAAVIELHLADHVKRVRVKQSGGQSHCAQYPMASPSHFVLHDIAAGYSLREFINPHSAPTRRFPVCSRSIESSSRRADPMCQPRRQPISQRQSESVKIGWQILIGGLVNEKRPASPEYAPHLLDVGVTGLGDVLKDRVCEYQVEGLVGNPEMSRIRDVDKGDLVRDTHLGDETLPTLDAFRIRLDTIYRRRADLDQRNRGQSVGRAEIQDHPMFDEVAVMPKRVPECVVSPLLNRVPRLFRKGRLHNHANMQPTAGGIQQ